jgi:phytol kinase
VSRFLYGFGMVILYFVVFIGIIIPIRKLFSTKSEKFRKTLHMGALFSIFVFLYAFKFWWHAVIACLILIIIIFPVLHFAERLKGYSTLLVQRKPNEVKWSMIQIFTAFSIVLTVGWGLFNSRYLALASLFTWGFGDAAAALVGKRFGKRKLRGRLIEGVKSVEGSVAMALVAFVACAIVLFVKGETPWYISLIAAGAAAVVASIVELYTRNGADTITCPLAALVVLSVILWAFGGITPVWM